MNGRQNQQRNRGGSSQAMNDPDHQRPHTLINAEAADCTVEQRLRLDKGWYGFTISREILGQALHYAGKIEHSEKDQHQGH